MAKAVKYCQPRVFLGGTQDSDWRDKLIPKLRIDYFNPLSHELTPEFKDEIEQQKASCTFLLTVITPNFKDFEDTLRVVIDSSKQPEKTLLYVLQLDNGKSYTEAELTNMNASESLVYKNGAKTFGSMRQVAAWLNNVNE